MQRLLQQFKGASRSQTATNADHGSASQLAPDLLLHIFEYTYIPHEVVRPSKYGQLLLLSRVSRAWSDCAVILLYRDVRLSSPKAAFCFLTTLKSSSLGDLVVTLSLSCSVYGFTDLGLGREEKISVPGQDRLMETVLHRCGRLTKLSIHSSTHWGRVFRLPEPGSFSVLRDIRCLYLDSDIYTSRSSHWLRRAILNKSLVLPLLEELFWHNDGDVSDIVDDLSFPSLRVLHLKGHPSDDTESNDSVYAALLSAAPHTLQEVALRGLSLHRAHTPDFTRFTTLRVLALELQQISPGLLYALLDSAHETLESLDIRLAHDNMLHSWPHLKRLRKLTLASTPTTRISALGDIIHSTLQELEILRPSQDIIMPLDNAAVDVLSFAQNVKILSIPDHYTFPCKGIQTVLPKLTNLHTFTIVGSGHTNFGVSEFVRSVMAALPRNIIELRVYLATPLLTRQDSEYLFAVLECQPQEHCPHLRIFAIDGPTLGPQIAATIRKMCTVLGLVLSADVRTEVPSVMPTVAPEDKSRTALSLFSRQKSLPG